MPRLPPTIATVQSLATQFLSELDISNPPLSVDTCLEARHLRLVDERLETLLRDAGITVPVQLKLDAMLEVRGRRVWLKEALHPHQRKFGTLHEVGHDVIPWQRELLYYCSLFDLPPSVQQEWEREATAFAVECMFLGGRFMKEAVELPFGLRSAKELAERFVASYEAAFRHYVERHHRACCLLVCRPAVPRGGLWVLDQPLEYEIQYYVNSPSFRGRILPRQRFSCPAITKLFTLETLDDIVEHEVTATGPGGDVAYHAQSFTNSYKVFTLLSPTAFSP